MVAFSEWCCDPLPRLFHHLCYVFTSLCAHTAENHLKIVREGSLPYIVRLLQSQNPKIQEQAAGTLRNLAVNGTVLSVVTVKLFFG
jgi:hypothetical protein